MKDWDTVVSDTGPLISLEAIPAGFQWIQQEDLVSLADAKRMWTILLEENRITETLYRSLIRDV